MKSLLATVGGGAAAPPMSNVLMAWVQKKDRVVAGFVRLGMCS